MNAYQLIFKSGASVVVHTDAAEEDLSDEFQVTWENVDAIIDVTQNLTNESSWLNENKVIKDITRKRMITQIQAEQEARTAT